MSIYLRNFTRFILLVLIQCLLLNKLSLRWWSSPGEIPTFIPFIYPLFILLLPFTTKTPVALIVGFVLGIVIDAFMDTGGMHAAACVLMAFTRGGILKFILPRKLTEYGLATPSPKTMGGWSPFLSYAIVLLLIHHLAYFVLEVWSFSSLGYILLKVAITLFTSMVFVVLYALLFAKSIQED